MNSGALRDFNRGMIWVEWTDRRPRMKYEGDSLRTLNHIVRECDQTPNCRISAFPSFLIYSNIIEIKKSSFQK